MQQGIVNKRLVSSILYMDTREINKGVIDINGDGGFDGLMIEAKRYRKTTQPQYHHFVNENVLEVLEVLTVTGSTTAALNVTVTTTGFARQGDKFVLPNGKVAMINSAITTASSEDSFTMTSVDGTNLTLATGNKMAPNGLVVGEKSKGVDSLVYSQTKYFNQIEFLRDKISLTDVQMQSTVEVGDGYYVYTQSLEQAKSFKLKLAASLYGGVKSVNQYGTASPTLLDRDGNSVQTTGGVFNEVDTYGVSDAVATLDTVLMSDEDDLLDQLLGVKAPSDYLLLSPDRAWRKKDDLYKNLGSSGITSVRLELDGNEINCNVSRFKKGKFTLDYAPLPLADHPELFNFQGASKIGKCILGFPKDKVKVESAAVNGATSMLPRVGVRYFPNPKKNKNQGTEYIQETQTGGLAPIATDDEQVLNISYISRQGAEVAGAKVMFTQQVLS